MPAAKKHYIHMRLENKGKQNKTRVTEREGISPLKMEFSLLDEGLLSGIQKFDFLKEASRISINPSSLHSTKLWKPK